MGWYLVGIPYICSSNIATCCHNSNESLLPSWECLTALAQIAAPRQMVPVEHVFQSLTKYPPLHSFAFLRLSSLYLTCTTWHGSGVEKETSNDDMRYHNEVIALAIVCVIIPALRLTQFSIEQVSGRLMGAIERMERPATSRTGST